MLIKYLRHLKKNNKGSSMVVVIVAMAFVGILAATIMWMSLNNFYMKATDVKHKRSFYSSETVMEQIVAGLQVDVSHAIDLSYHNVMQKYANKTEEERQKAFRDEYLLRLQEIFKAGGTNTYEMSRLRGYINGYADVTSKNFSVTEGSGKLTAIRGGVESEVGDMQTYTDDAYVNKNYVVLKDVHLEFTDTNGFVSMISTDIQLVLPEISFAQSSTIPDVFEFALIASDTLEDDNVTFSNPVTINGSIYGGKNGISIHHPWNFAKGEMMVTGKDIELKNPLSSLKVGDEATSDKPMLWADNIILSEGKNLDIYAKTYLSDDILVNTSGTTVKLQGECYGYGDSLTDSSMSSAIVVNGINTTLDMSGLNEVLLAGHSYIGTSNAVKNIAPSVSTNAIYQKNEDILMGESIAIKGDQIAYLVPDECIGVLDGVDVYGKNPMSAAEYEQLQNELKKCVANRYIDAEDKEHTLYEVDFNKMISGLNAPISAYTNEIKKVFCPSNGETVVYYYLVMDELAANKYFEDYYHVKKAKLDQYFSVYAGGGIQSNTSFTRVNVQGNWLSDADAKTPLDQTKLNAPTAMDATSLSEETTHYADMFASLQAKLVTNYYEVSNAEKARSVYENILITNDATLNAFVASHSSCTWTTDDGITAIVTNGNYTHAGADKTRLIIAKGDVYIETDYTGLVIAGGSIYIKEGVTISNASEDATRDEQTRVLMMPFDATDPDSPKPIDFIKNGSDIIAGTLVDTSGMDSAQKSIDFSEIVLYANWTKK